jgi:hypothetical protein
MSCIGSLSKSSAIVLDNLSSGFPEAVAEQAKLVIGDVGGAELVSRLIAEHPSTRSSRTGQDD